MVQPLKTESREMYKVRSENVPKTNFQSTLSIRVRRCPFHKNKRPKKILKRETEIIGRHNETKWIVLN